MQIQSSTGFKKLVLLSIVLIYLLILAGGIVRGTGSGMGCPDWPKCFGEWIPPTHISQLPIDYKEKFKVGHRTIADFSAFKTWVEYTNRLLGVLVGFSVFAVFIVSLWHFNHHSSVVYLSTAIVLLTGFQGWVGSKVVSSHLAQSMVTIHMLIALVIVALALILYSKLGSRPTEPLALNDHWLLFLSFLTLVQIMLGTQIRQEVDTIAIRYNELHRELWIQELGNNFIIHRIMAGVIVVLNTAYALYVVKRAGLEALISKLAVAILLVFISEYVTGMGMVGLSIPYFIQPIHLLLASVVFGLQIYVWLLIRPINETKTGSLIISK